MLLFVQITLYRNNLRIKIKRLLWGNISIIAVGFMVFFKTILARSLSSTGLQIKHFQLCISLHLSPVFSLFNCLHLCLSALQFFLFSCLQLCLSFQLTSVLLLQLSRFFVSLELLSAPVSLFMFLQFFLFSALSISSVSFGAFFKKIRILTISKTMTGCPCLCPYHKAVKSVGDKSF